MWKQGLFLLLIVLAVSHFRDTNATKCKNPAGVEVDWWFFIKPPSVDDTILYADPITSNLELKIEKGVIEKLFAGSFKEKERNKNANEELTRNKYKVKYSGRREDYESTIAEDSRTKVTDGIKLIHYWFNDQPFTQEPITSQRLYFDSPDYRWAHSKYLLSWDLENNNGVFLQHTFPAVPIAWPELNNQEPKIFDKKKKNVFQFSQHAFCLSLDDEASFESVLNATIWSRGRAIYLNFPPYMLPDTFKLKDRLQDVIDGAEGVNQGITCTEEWERYTTTKLNPKQKKELLSLDPLDSCTKDFTFSSSNVRMFAHAPTQNTGDKADAVESDDLTTDEPLIPGDENRMYKRGP